VYSFGYVLFVSVLVYGDVTTSLAKLRENPSKLFTIPQRIHQNPRLFPVFPLAPPRKSTFKPARARCYKSPLS